MDDYTARGNAINQILAEGQSIITDNIQLNIKKIRDELAATNDETAQSHIDVCDDLINKIQSVYVQKITDEMTKINDNARIWQGWYDYIAGIVGNKLGEVNDTYQEVDDPATGHTISHTLEFYYKIRDLGIDANGYISFLIESHKVYDAVYDTILVTNSCVIKDESTLNAYKALFAPGGYRR